MVGSFGSTIEFASIGYTNLGAGITLRESGQIEVLCDSDGVIEYSVDNAVARLYLAVRGYRLKRQ